MSGHGSQRDRRSHPLDRMGSEDVIGWRTRRLAAAGFEVPLARELASDCDVDLHALLELTDRGCPPTLAARIMAPL